MITVVDPGGQVPAQGITVVDPGGGAAPPTSYDPTQGMTGLDKFLAGAGKSFSDLGLGAKQVIAALGAHGLFSGDQSGDGSTSPVDWKSLVSSLATEADTSKSRDAPLMNTGAGTAGDITGQVVQSAVMPVGGAATGLGRMGLSALAGGVQAGMQPVGTNGSRLADAAMGAGMGAAGQGVANMVGAAIRPAVAGDPARQAAVDWANANGATMSLGDITGAPFTQRIEKVLSNLPGSRGFYKDATQSKNDAILNAVNGITSGDAGNLIQQAGAGHTFTVDQPLINDLQSIAGNFAGLADADAPNSALKTIAQYVGTQTPNPALVGFKPAVKAQAIAKGVPEFVNGGNAKYAVGDTMPMVGPYGDFNNYQALRSLYGQRAFGQGDPADKAAYSAIQDALDSAAQRSMPPDAGDAMQSARQAYAVQKTVQPSTVTDVNGDVTGYNAARLAGLVSQKEAKQPGMLDNLGTAGSSLRDIANFAKTIQPANSSGTAENTLASKMATLEILQDLFDSGGMGKAAKAAFGLMGAPMMINAGMQSTRNGIPLLRDAPMSLQMLLRQSAAAGPAALVSQ